MTNIPIICICQSDPIKQRIRQFCANKNHTYPLARLKIVQGRIARRNIAFKNGYKIKTNFKNF